jgi:hypothetical protein
MALLDGIPAESELINILAPVLGDESAGTGVAGVLKLLEQFDTSSVSDALINGLDQAVSADISIETDMLTGGALSSFQQAVNAIPGNPETLIASVSKPLESLKALSSEDLSKQLLTGIDGLENIETLIPVDTRELVAQAAESLTQLKGEFISGELGQLMQWSESVQTLWQEIEPLLTSGEGTIEERLITFLREKITDLVLSLLPNDSLVLVLTKQLDTAISTDRAKGIAEIQAKLIGAMNLARSEFENGNFTNTTQLAAAQAEFQKLTTALENITNALRPVLEQEIVTADGLARALQRQYDNFAQIEIVDLGNIKDKFAAAIKRVEEVIEDLDLDAVSETVDELFKKISSTIEKFDLSELTSKLADLRKQLESILNALDGVLLGAIASIRNIFTQIKGALQTVVAALGSYDDDGKFRFHVQKDIEDFLDSVKTTLRKTIQPLLEQFRDTVKQTLQQVEAGLNAVKDEIAGVRTKLEGVLSGIHQQLQAVDVETKMQDIRNRLDAMLKALGDIDFDPVVDPVVAEINEMRDSLKEIDVSSLNDLTIGALKIAVEVLENLDFTGDITDYLMSQFDALIQIPKDQLGNIETSVESALQQFGKLAPDMLLAPLDDLFAPITKLLDALELETLLKPLDDWYGQIKVELDKVSPASLLQPVIDLHTKLESAFDAISPTELIRPLQTAIDSVKDALQAIDITGIASELGDAIDRAKRALDEVSPDRLLNPLVNAFDKIMKALDRFDPTVLLKPFTAIFDALTAPLGNLNADHVRVISEIFKVLRGLLDAFDPRRVFQAVQQKLAALQGLLQQLNIGSLIAALKVPYDALFSAFNAAGGIVNTTLSASIEALNPLRNQKITQAATAFQQFQTRLSALSQAKPPDELVRRYEEIRPKLESLIPTWATDNMSPDSIRRAFQLANPLNVAGEVSQLWDTVKQQLRNFDPRLVQNKVKVLFDKLKDTIFALDPESVVTEVQSVINTLTKKLDTLDLQMVVNELQGIADELKSIVDGLDPQPIINQLQELVGEVTKLVEALQPSTILSELNDPISDVKSVVKEFSPNAFKQALQAVFEEVQTILEAIDVGLVLEPLMKLLERLREELAEGLGRTKTAFDGMLEAIPV